MRASAWIVVAAACGLGLAPNLEAPSATLTVQHLGPISVDDQKTRHVEPWLAINPGDPSNLIAASMVLGTPIGVVVYSSHDGGRTWERGVSQPDQSAVFPGQDPSLAFDRLGHAYLTTGENAVESWTSTDGGRTWGQHVVALATPADRPFIACDLRDDPRLGGRLYLVAKSSITIFGHRAAEWSHQLDALLVATSRDHGVGFGFPNVFATDPDRMFLNVDSGLLVAPDGRVLVTLQTFPQQDFKKPLLAASSHIIVSTDGGRSFSDPQKIADWHTFGHGAEGKSLFGLGGGQLALDTSQGPFAGSLYFVWLDVVGAAYQVMTSASRDGGATWSAGVRVRDDDSPTDASNPGIAVDGQGRVAVLWNDRRSDPTDRCFQAYFASSADGGRTFSPNRPLHATFTCPIGRPPAPGSTERPVPDRGIDATTAQSRFKNGGDTEGIVGLPAGGFELAWINGESGELQLWTALLRPERPHQP